MGQFQTRTGPVTNNAAAFSPEMVAGSLPPTRPRLSLGPRIPPPLSQTTHIAAGFSVEMAAGVQGESYPAPRLHFGARIPPPISQPTHTAAPFSTEMTSGAQGVRFPSPRIHLGVRIPQPLSQQTTHVQAAFSTPMASGAQGTTWPSPRILLGQKIPLPLSQTTHDSAAFSAEMVAGVTVAKPRISVGRQIAPPTFIYLDSFAYDSVLASQLDARNHLTRPQHWSPFSQTTHVAAPFSLEMTAGVTAPLPRILVPRQIRLPDLVQVLEFSFESVLGGRLDFRNHLTRPQHLAALAQTTQVSAPFSMEMVSWARDAKGRLRPTERQPAIGDVVFVDAFAFESVLGLRLDSRNHLVYPLHIPPIGQPLHVAAPFSLEMVAGTQGPASQNHFKWWPIGFTTDASLLIALEAAPDTEGLEFTVLQKRLHFKAGDKRLHFVLIPQRLHFKLHDEDQ